MDFEVDKADLHRCRIVERDPEVLADGQARLAVDFFAFTANNITYAVFGDAMRYWDFFPTEAGWGRVPVWGFAEVVESRCEGVEVGTRLYGYLPMSTELVVTPGKVGEQGFVDLAAHRAPMAAAYNRYTVVGDEPGYRADLEEHRAVLFPLFFTSFLLDDLLADNADFGAASVILSSASSKTSLGTAYQASQRGGVEVVGLTSAANRDFVEGLGVYHRVVLYDDVASLAGTSAVYVDVAGDPALRAEVHRACGDDLLASLTVGASHWEQTSVDVPGDLPGPRPEFFFAPTQIAKRNDDWGPEGLNERVDQAWDRFVTWTQGWLTLDHGAGAAALEATYLDVLGNRSAPQSGHILAPAEPT